MTYNTVVTLWQTVRDRFTKLAEGLTEQQLELREGKSHVGGMLYHTAEVEFMFADWFFGKAIPEQYGIGKKQEGQEAKAPYANKEELLQFMNESNAYLLAAMKELPEEAWTKGIESKMGLCSPLESVGRLMYHAGLHAGIVYSMKQKDVAE